MSDFLVSVLCITYNHSNYIKDTLNGFLNQKTNFKFNIVIFDDASTDGTSDIILDYQNRYPEIFDVHISPINTNKLPIRNDILHSLYEHNLVGKYVAICEGDDYWIDENKLQQQVEYMEQHDECTMTAHATKWLDCNKNTIREYHPYTMMGYLDGKDIIIQPNGSLSTASLVMRKEIIMGEEGFPVCDVADWPWQLYAITKGKIYYFDKTMAVYRYMHNGSWSRDILNNFNQRMIHCYGVINFLIEYDKYTQYMYSDIIRHKIVQYQYEGMRPYLPFEVQEYNEKSLKLDNDTDNAYAVYNTEQRRIFGIIKEKYYFSSSEKEMLSRYDDIVIMGMGEYAGHIKNVFMDNNISYAGNIVTKLPNDNSDKRVWSLESYPYCKEDTLVVVGISQLHETEIMDSLSKCGYTNIYTPMWFDITVGAARK